MTFELDQRYVKIQQEARALAAGVAPFAAEADGLSTVDARIHGALAASGLCTLVVPAAYGGRFETVDPLAVCVVREVLMATSAQADSLFALQGIGSYAISVAGSPAQKEEWLPRVAHADALAALALTEPAIGSDLRAVTTIAVSRDGEITIAGEKSFISNGGAAAFYTVLAREDDDLSLFIVRGDAAGLTVMPTPELIAPHVLGELSFRNVVVQQDARLGEPGAGLELVLATLSVFRASVAGAAVGLAQAALDEAVRHANERIQFGRPLLRLGAVGDMLADAWTEIEMARLLAYRAAARARSDPASALVDSSMAKLAATEAASRVVDRCVQVMGRFGLVRGSTIERLYRQARPMRIYEGASEVLRRAIANELGRDVSR